jgi:serine/threonine protein kinase
MEPTIWDRIQDLYYLALPIAPPDRTDFVARACDSDPVVMREVCSLLEADESSGDFLNSPMFGRGLKIITSSSADKLEDASPGPSLDLIGVTIDGRYLVEKELSRGGIGIVYLARDLKLYNRPVVVKVLLEKSLQNERVVQKFHQEKEALTRLNHPGVVNIFDAGELSDGKPYIVMQHVVGISLRDAISLEPNGMDFEHAAAIIKGVGSALGAVHNKNIYHRDLKPENVMLERLGPGEEQIKILDFGVAKVRQSLVAPSTMTGAGALGTVVYMSPEQLRAETVTAASDIYSFAIIAYEMVTGRRPFNPDTIANLAEMQRHGVPVKPKDLRPRLADEAQAIILNGLAFGPGERREGARRFGDDLAHALVSDDVEGAPVRIPPHAASTLVSNSAPVPQSHTLASEPQPSLPATLKTSDASKAGTTRKRWLVGAIGVVFLLASGVATYLFVSRRETNTRSSSSLPHRALTYSLTVQKMRDGLPYKDPFDSSGQEIFENGYKFRLNVSSRQAGYLYVFNEGAAEKDGTGFTIIYPTIATQEGSARVEQNQDVQTNWNTFSGETGTERFWIAWSATAITELEIARHEAFKNKEGALTDPAMVKNLKDFLVQRSAPQPETTKDTAKQRTSVRANGDLLVKLVELEHR